MLAQHRLETPGRSRRRLKERRMPGRSPGRIAPSRRSPANRWILGAFQAARGDLQIHLATRSARWVVEPPASGRHPSRRETPFPEQGDQPLAEPTYLRCAAARSTGEVAQRREWAAVNRMGPARLPGGWRTTRPELFPDHARGDSGTIHPASQSVRIGVAKRIHRSAEGVLQGRGMRMKRAGWKRPPPCGVKAGPGIKPPATL